MVNAARSTELVIIIVLLKTPKELRYLRFPAVPWHMSSIPWHVANQIASFPGSCSLVYSNSDYSSPLDFLRLRPVKSTTLPVERHHQPIESI